jgi:hypothetical protein
MSYAVPCVFAATCIRLSDNGKGALPTPLHVPAGAQRKDQVSHGNLVSCCSGYRTLQGLVAPATARSAVAGTATVAAASLSRAVAVGAVYRPIAPGFERHLGVFAALGANRRVHLAFAAAVAAVAAATAVAAAAVTRSLAGGAAVGATTGGGETLGLVEFLLALGEHKLHSAVDAGEVLV